MREAICHIADSGAVPSGEGPDFYCVDEDFGPFFLKLCSYFPYNGHEYLKRQLAKRKAGVRGPRQRHQVVCRSPTAAETERRPDRREDRSAIAQMAGSLATSVSHVSRLAEREFSAATLHTSIKFSAP